MMVSEFELQSLCYVHYRINILDKGIKSFGVGGVNVTQQKLYNIVRFWYHYDCIFTKKYTNLAIIKLSKEGE